MLRFRSFCYAKLAKIHTHIYITLQNILEQNDYYIHEMMDGTDQFLRRTLANL